MSQFRTRKIAVLHLNPQIAQRAVSGETSGHGSVLQGSHQQGEHGSRERGEHDREGEGEHGARESGEHQEGSRE